MWNVCLKKHVLHYNEKLIADLQEMAVMKQAILGLHSSRGSTSQVKRTSTGVHGPESHLRTSAAQDTSSHVTHRPKPTIFVSWWDGSQVHGILKSDMRHVLILLKLRLRLFCFTRLLLILPNLIAHYLIFNIYIYFF